MLITKIAGSLVS